MNNVVNNYGDQKKLDDQKAYSLTQRTVLDVKVLYKLISLTSKDIN